MDRVWFDFMSALMYKKNFFCSVATFGLEQALIQNRIGYTNTNGRWVHDFLRIVDFLKLLFCSALTITPKICV
jgi:hypothetical protein